MSNEKKDNSKELALIKEAFAHSIDQKQAHIIRMRLELEMRNQRVFGNFYHISNGRIIENPIGFFQNWRLKMKKQILLKIQ